DRRADTQRNVNHRDELQSCHGGLWPRRKSHIIHSFRSGAGTPEAEITRLTVNSDWTCQSGDGRYAACFALASKRARAFFPSLAAIDVLSKKTGELSSGPQRQAR